MATKKKTKKKSKATRRKKPGPKRGQGQTERYKNEKLQIDIIDSIEKSETIRQHKEAELKAKALEISDLRKSGWHRLIRMFDAVGKMTSEQVTDAYENNHNLTVEERAVLRFMLQMQRSDDVKRFQFYFSVFGIPTDIKAVTVKELGNIFDQATGMTSGKAQIDNLSKEEKIILLDKMKSLIKKEVDGPSKVKTKKAMPEWAKE